MKTVLVALLAAGLLLPTDAYAAEKKEGQALQQPQAQNDNPRMTRRYRTQRHYRTTRNYRSTRRYRTAGYRTYRTRRCDPFMRQWFGVCN